ncbi:suppressor protein stp22 of temperature-sensitive alpha-factor receptor and arginine permease [Malassezia obtusa]|uniref:Suppressor protein stp22 of temperature-sensitive alpha-factor receptor and arginine permease n=1 Tax=Malassezia obtusa TaxID=76774 RepID=A0AAF0IT84_9BASI|nr:suppressor protein stp22 of temperature-sensitive alpha-factor receptor and arginine permease [Malassezia obtusa]
MDRAVVQRWLRQVLEPYAARERLYSDVDRTLIEYPTLLPRTDVYTYDDGRAALLLLLDGTLPVEYGGTVYYIPIQVWIPRAYPRDPPIVYVVPTRDMLVRRSRQVDPSGHVVTEYAERWAHKPEGADLLELLQTCQALFRTEPPVVAKPRETRPAPPARPPRPAPETAAHASPDGPAHAAPAAAPTPPKPAAPPRPPVPERPAAPHDAAPLPARSAPTQPARPMNPELRALHDAVHTKLAARRDGVRRSLTHANAQLRDVLDDLHRGYPAIQDEMQRLEAVQTVCRTHAAQLTSTMHTAQERLHDLQRRADPNVDAMLAATSLVENQLAQLLAEDAALEDTMYQLGRALLAEQLSLDRFIKQTRMLSREQFLRRALAKKIQDGLRTAT